jgi:CubicO group peptidase (beta-lactamase class C family)
VIEYLPEYAAGGKGDTTLRHLLAHRAGIPQLAISEVDPAVIFDWESAVQLLCGAKPVYQRDAYQAYHAITAGFILGEVVRRVSGQTLHAQLKKWIAKPLGCEYVTYGLPPRQRERAARNYSTGPRSWFPLTLFARRILGVEFERVVDISNEPHFLSSVIPAGNIYATADDVARFYQMMLDQGEFEGRRVFKPETVAEATRAYSHITLDRSLLLPVRFSPGMILGEWPVGMYGQNTPNAYGHLGFLTILGWADPDRGISVGFLNTGKSLALPGLLAAAKVIYRINKYCPRI